MWLDQRGQKRDWYEKRPERQVEARLYRALLAMEKLGYFSKCNGKTLVSFEQVRSITL